MPEFLPDSVEWYPLVNDARFLLRVACPDGTVQERLFDFGEAPVFSLLGEDGVPSPDGVYTYELIPVPVTLWRTQAEKTADVYEKMPPQKIVQSGYFRVQGGAVVLADDDEEASADKDILQYDDVIATGTCASASTASTGSPSATAPSS